MTSPDYQPEYRRIERSLRTWIAGMRPGDRLPSDAELCAEFRVSRMTARNAMQRLAEDGLVSRVPGRGSFVAEPPAHRRANRLMTFSQEMARQGRRPSSRLVERQIRKADARQAADLGLDAGEPVIYLQRIRCADDKSIAIETSVIAGACAEAVMAADLETGSLHTALIRSGHVPRRGTGTIRAAAASAEDARLLGIRKGDPMLVERRVIADTHGRRIEATESRYPADCYALEVRFEVEEPVLEVRSGQAPA
jgi:GntR family transcriptional regulator